MRDCSIGSQAALIIFFSCTRHDTHKREKESILSRAVDICPPPRFVMFFRELRPGFCTRATKYDIGTNNSIKQCATRLEKSDDSARWIAVDENKKCQQSTSGHRRARVGWHDICGSVLFFFSFPFLFSSPFFFFFSFFPPLFFLFLSQWKYGTENVEHVNLDLAIE